MGGGGGGPRTTPPAQPPSPSPGPLAAPPPSRASLQGGEGGGGRAMKKPPIHWPGPRQGWGGPRPTSSPSGRWIDVREGSLKAHQGHLSRETVESASWFTLMAFLFVRSKRPPPCFEGFTHHPVGPGLFFFFFFLGLPVSLCQSGAPLVQAGNTRGGGCCPWQAQRRYAMATSG